jgi:excisionase family DNA binding protein
MNDDILYKPEEIAQKLKITKGTVYEMIKRGDLEAHRIGKHLRISGPQLELYLLKSKGAENRYEASITHEDGEKVANIGAGVNIYDDGPRP